MFKVAFIDCNEGVNVITCNYVDYSDERYLICKEGFDNGKRYIVKALIPHDKVRHVIANKDGGEYYD